MAPTELAHLSIREASSGLRRKDFSPSELTRACLERIESIDHKLHSFITVTADLALEQARNAKQELRAGTDKGPLHGIPIALKDLYATEGIRTTCHSAVLQDWVGVPRVNWFNENKGTDPEPEAIFDNALTTLESLSAVVVEIDGRPFSIAPKANQTILIAEAYAYHEKRFQEAPEKFGSSVRQRMLEGAFLSAADYITALRARTVLNEHIRANFAAVDIFVTPSALSRQMLLKAWTLMNRPCGRVSPIHLI
jgi:Asp-tRNA(Asn)/Glu-tRNA(Gln) amidotransferase A subunit family amidase